MLATREDARAHWADAPTDDAILDTLLSAAEEQVLEYAPALPALAPVPARYMLATVYHAAEVYAAGTRNGSDVIAVGDFPIRARELTTTVKALLRPRRGFAGVG